MSAHGSTPSCSTASSTASGSANENTGRSQFFSPSPQESHTAISLPCQ